jgi:uncharacterized protein
MPIDLPIIESCDGCGACCMHMGSPPAFGIFFPRAGHEITLGARDREDYQIIKAMPSTLRDELHAYYHSGVDRGAENLPCLWLDLDTKKCRHYEHRPTICRNFEMSSEHCHGHRQTRGIE